MATLSIYQIDDLERRFAIVKRHLHALGLSSDDLEAISRNLHGLAKVIKEIETELQARQAEQSDGERVAQRAREVVYQQRPREVKTIHN